MPESADIMSAGPSNNDIETDAELQKSYKMPDCVDGTPFLTKLGDNAADSKHSGADSLKKMAMETDIGASAVPSSMAACGAAHIESSKPQDLKESGCSITMAESFSGVSSTAQQCSPQKSSIKGWGGARPKTTLSTTKKGVTWSKETSTKTCIDNLAFEQYRTLLKALRVEDDLLNSPGVRANQIMLDTDIAQSPERFEMAAKMLRVKLDRFPKASELSEVFMYCDEMQIVTDFFEACQTERGNSLMKTLQLQDVKNEQQTSGYKQQEDSISEPEEIPQVHFENNMELQKTQVLPTEMEAGISPPQKETDIHEMSILALKREQKYLKESLTCVLCKERPVEVTLLPCGHFVLCAQCSDTCYVCPVCNKTALGEVKTYLG